MRPITRPLSSEALRVCSDVPAPADSVRPYPQAVQLAVLVLSTSDTKTMIAASFDFVGEGSMRWGVLMAAATLIALPPLMLAVVAQRWLIAGLTLGAVKA